VRSPPVRELVSSRPGKRVVRFGYGSGLYSVRVNFGLSPFGSGEVWVQIYFGSIMFGSGMPSVRLKYGSGLFGVVLR